MEPSKPYMATPHRAGVDRYFDDGADVLEESHPLDRQRRRSSRRDDPSSETVAAERIQGYARARRRSSVRTRSLDPGGEGSVELSHPKRPSPEPLMLAGAGGGATPGRRRRRSTRPGGAMTPELQPAGLTM